MEQQPQAREAGARKPAVDWKLIGSLAAGVKHHLAWAAVCVLLAVCASYAIPFVTSFTLDYVIRGDASGLRLPAWLLAWLDALGGRDYLVSHLYLCAIALVLLTALRDCSARGGGKTTRRKAAAR